MPEKFDPTRYKSYEELPEEERYQFKPVEGGFVRKDAIENPEEAKEEAEKYSDSISAPEKKEKKEELNLQQKPYEKDVAFDEEDEEEYEKSKEMENMGDYRESISMVLGVIAQIDKEMRNKGGIDFLREGFWNNLYLIEKKLSPKKPLRELLQEKIYSNSLLNGIARYTYWRELCLFDTFNYLKSNGVLDEKDKELFLNAMPPFGYFNASPSLKKDMPDQEKHIFWDVDDIKTLQKSPTIDMLNYHIQLLKQINEKGNIKEIDKTIEERVHLYYLTWLIPFVYYRGIVEDVESPQFSEEIIRRGEEQYPGISATYLKFKKDIERSAFERGKINIEDSWHWSDEHEYSLRKPNLIPINQQISILEKDKVFLSKDKK